MTSRTDAEIYNENALSWIKARGEGAEIHSGEKEYPKSESWDAWFCYFQQIGHQTMLRIMTAHENRAWIGKNGVTVPSEWPQEFDVTATRKVSRPKLKLIENLTDAERAEVVRKAMANTGFHPKGVRRGRPVSPEELLKEPRRLQEALQAQEEQKLVDLKKMDVPKLSDAALKFMAEENRRRDLEP
jgi:hypothetical protein